MNRPRCKVCHLSVAHNWYDERIFQKEAKSLAKAGYNVAYIVPYDRCDVVDGVQIIPLTRPTSRLRRLFLSRRVFRLALKQRAAIYHFHDPELIPLGVAVEIGRKEGHL